MVIGFQPSLLDLDEDVAIGPLGARVRRTWLSGGAWLDVRRGWLTGADALFQRLLDVVPWRAERRQMYDRVVAVPRLLCFYGEDEQLPDPALDGARRALDAHYATELGERFATAGLCLYRDGRDSVAWHGDRIARTVVQPLVATVSLGSKRRFLLRPKGGGASVRFDPDKGDLLVMGGQCQRTWEHTVPKVADAGPRISITVRHSA